MAGPQLRFVLFLFLILVFYTLILMVFQKLLTGFLPLIAFLPIALVTILLFIAVAGTVYSHTFLGPMGRIRKAIEQSAEGKISLPLRLRESDDPMLKDLASAIGMWSDQSRNAQTTVKEAVEELFSDIAVLEEKLRAGADKTEVRKQMEIIKTRQAAVSKSVQSCWKTE